MCNGQSDANEQTLSTNIYSADRKSKLEEVQYGNGGKVKYSYDDFDRVTGITHDNDTAPKFTYEYDAKGRAAVVRDTTDGSTIRNNYDQTDRPTESEQRDGNDDLKYRTLIEYDVKNRVKAFNEATDSEAHRTEYTYDKDNRATEVKYNGSNSTKVNYTYDKLNRVTNRTVTNGTAYATQFGYVQGATAYGTNATTPLVQSITQGSGANALNFSYTYDSRGNITSETRNGVTTTYEYDALGQLVRVNDPNDPTAHNEGALSDNGTTWIYAYDRGGNILSKTAYAYTTDAVGTPVRTWLYEYNDANWKDKLTKFDGNTITYDAIGNPLNDGTWTYTWQAGRQLKSMSNAATGVTMEFTYNHVGLRTKKVKKVNGTAAETTEYILNGKTVVELSHTNHDTSEINKLHFYYDTQGMVALVDFNGTLYSYAHNLQGDIIGILDTNGNLVVEYRYDAWGKPTSTTGTLTTTLGELNSFRYRGYVWDQETELYYLRSRYYCPVESRFVNCDYLLSLGNAFHYCRPNPIGLKDESGCKEQRFGDYLVVLNIRFGESKDDPGHFSFSLISINNPKASRINFSYGPGSVINENEKEYAGALTISYTPRHKVSRRYIVCTISTNGCSEILDFVFEKFIIEKQVLDSEEKVFTKHPVCDPLYSIYDGTKGHYCGSASGYILINCNDVFNDSKGRDLAELLQNNVIFANPLMLSDGGIDIIDYLESHGYERYEPND